MQDEPITSIAGVTGVTSVTSSPENLPPSPVEVPVKRRRGRPKGSKNKPKGGKKNGPGHIGRVRYVQACKNCGIPLHADNRVNLNDALKRGVAKTADHLYRDMDPERLFMYVERALGFSLFGRRTPLGCLTGDVTREIKAFINRHHPNFVKSDLRCLLDHNLTKSQPVNRIPDDAMLRLEHLCMLLDVLATMQVVKNREARIGPEPVLCDNEPEQKETDAA